MNEREPSSRSPSPAEEVYAGYLVEQDAGRNPDFEALCADNPALADELRRLHARERSVDARRRAAGLGSVAGGARAPGSMAEAIVAALRSHGAVSARYRIGSEIGRGGMGSVHEAEDVLLGRSVALKVIADPDRAEALLPLFRREMRLAARIGHPGVAGIYDAGLDQRGRAFFTMPLVRGRDLSEVFERVWRGEQGWTEARALGVLRQVCETMAYVHTRGVIHRDLKPSNVRVGDFGEAYVMDWGLAKEVSDEDDAPVDDGRPNEFGSLPGQARGTLPYMSPEQLVGDPALDSATDVYAIGVMLYELLAGHPPYLVPGQPVDRGELALCIVRESPPPLEVVAPRAPLELVAICGRAMARSSRDRYSDAQALAQDLQAYLDGRIPSAFPAGPWGQARKWVLRNRLPATLLAATLLLLLFGAIATLAWSSLQRGRERDLVDLLALQEVKRLRREQESLWPIRVQDEDRYRTWIQRAESLLSATDITSEQVARLREIEARGVRVSGTDGAGPRFLFDDPADTLWQENLSTFLADLAVLADPEHGLLTPSAASPEHGMSVGRRLEVCTGVLSPMSADPGVQQAWRTARHEVATDPRFAGFLVEPSDDLQPLRRDPVSGLWEFALVTTGTPPEVAPEGGYQIRADSAIVLVLLPGGRFWMGAQATDEDRPNFDTRANILESPAHEVQLVPFFLAKYEMTQGQWYALTRSEPSTYGAVGLQISLEDAHRLPVESVSWLECQRVLRFADLELPTEAQWEYAARAGTITPWWTGPEEASLFGAANVADRSAAGSVPNHWVLAPFDDGHPLHAPVGAFRPNPFGLHDTAGGVMEWCMDPESLYDAPPRAGDGLRAGVASAQKRCYRGGAWDGEPAYSRSAFRSFGLPGTRIYSLGVRPARLARPLRS